MQRVRNAYRLAKPQSREAQIIAQMKDIIEPAYEIYVRGYTNAARNLRNMEGGKQSITKMQARYTGITDVLNDFNIPENKISDYVYVQKNVYNTLLNDGFFDKNETVGSNIRKFRSDVKCDTSFSFVKPPKY